MQKKIILASNNPNKLAEFRMIFAANKTAAKYQICLQTEFGIQAVDETGLSFVENAILKARNASRYSKLPALADDSGLTVDALNGAPGVYSSRFAGAHATSFANVAKLLEELLKVEESRRTASFHCVLAYMRHAADPAPIICHGIWEGVILSKPQGQNGFGYDPIFFVPDHNCSAAELTPEVKNNISHRAKAMRHFLQLLEDRGIKE